MGDAIAPRAIGMYSQNSLQGCGLAFSDGCGRRVGNGIRADFRAGRNIKIQFQGKGASPGSWSGGAGSQGGSAIQSVDRIAASRFFASPNRSILGEPQYSSNTMLSDEGFSPYPTVSGSNRADLYNWKGG